MNRRAFVSSAFCSRFLSAVGWRSSQASALSAGASQSESSLTALRKSFQGAIYRKGDPRYEELRAVWSARMDQHPALILQPIDKDDVSAGVRFAKANGLASRGSARWAQLRRLQHLRGWSLTPTPSGRLRKVHERALWRLQVLDLLEDFAPSSRYEASPHP